MTQNIMTSALEASGPKKYFFAFSILLDGLAHISAIFLLKMQKKSKIGSQINLYYTMKILFSRAELTGQALFAHFFFFPNIACVWSI
jgi:hypothetical protein